jgi:hypothetical protein
VLFTKTVPIKVIKVRWMRWVRHVTRTEVMWNTYIKENLKEQDNLSDLGRVELIQLLTQNAFWRAAVEMTKRPDQLSEFLKRWRHMWSFPQRSKCDFNITATVNTRSANSRTICQIRPFPGKIKMLIFPSLSLVCSTIQSSNEYSGCYERRPATMLNKTGLYTVASLSIHNCKFIATQRHVNIKIWFYEIQNDLTYMNEASHKYADRTQAS